MNVNVAAQFNYEGQILTVPEDFIPESTVFTNLRFQVEKCQFIDILSLLTFFHLTLNKEIVVEIVRYPFNTV